MIYRQGPVMVLGATLIGLILAGFLWRDLGDRELGYWLLMVLLSAALRTLVFRSFRLSNSKSARETSPDPSAWGLLFWVTSMFAGAIWGLLPVLFVAELSSEKLLLVSTVFAGMIAVTASAGSIYPPTFYSFALPMVIPLILLELTSGNEVLIVTATMLILYLLVNLLLVRRGHQQFVALVEARYENANLMEKINQEKEIAETAVKIKDRFIATASHDLRQPLHALGMFISSLKKRELDTDRLELVNNMETSTRSLGELLHGLLDVSRLDANAVSPMLASVQFDEVVGVLREEFSVQAQNRNLDLHIPSSDLVLYTDSMLLERILRNLFTNALAYTSTGSVSLTLEQVVSGSIDILVTDTGAGIPEQERDAVFLEYYRGLSVDQSTAHFHAERPREKSDQRDSGMGLGLSIVQRLCRLLEIPLNVETGFGGVGTTFRLRVPLSESVVEASTARETVNLNLTGKLILIIDDEPLVQRSLSRWLSDHGAEVVEAGSAKNALATMAVQESLPDLIVCDYRLSNQQNGLDTIAALREAAQANIPAFVISADTSPEVLRAVSDSQLPLLHKPVNEVPLARLIASLV